MLQPTWVDTEIDTKCDTTIYLERTNYMEMQYQCISSKSSQLLFLGDNCIQTIHLGRYMVGYMVGNFVLRRHISGAVKSNFRPYNR